MIYHHIWHGILTNLVYVGNSPFQPEVEKNSSACACVGLICTCPGLQGKSTLPLL